MISLFLAFGSCGTMGGGISKLAQSVTDMVGGILDTIRVFAPLR